MSDPTSPSRSVDRLKAPSYKGLVPASPAASKVKQRNRSRNTAAELLLRRELWKRGLRYRLHAQILPGKPDLVFPRQKLAVFCDGDFWHGRDWQERRLKLERGTNAHYWVQKIEANMKRDVRQTQELMRMGWRVLRLWETDIKRDCGRAADAVETALLSV